MRVHVKKLQFIICCIGTLALAACKDPSFFQALGEKIATDTLSIAPPKVTVPINGTVTFTASGGSAPYSYVVVPARALAIDPSSGAYTAPTTQGTETVRVTDRKGHTADAAVTIAGNTGALSIQPSTVSINVGGIITFVATGGSGTYSFAMQTSASGPPTPTVIAATGKYTAGNSSSTVDKVRVSDGVTFIDATINVTATNSPVNYDISAAALPAAGTGGTTAGGYSFTIHNGGSGAGGAPISWWVFLSPTPVPGSGSALLDSGTYAGPVLAPGATTVVPLSWTWPSFLPPGSTGYLYIMISAADDLTPANNTYTSAALPLNPANVHYTVSGVTNTGGIAAGGPLAGQFTVTNAGADPGTYTANWKAYVSTDGSQRIDAGAILVASGSFAPLNGGASTLPPITISGAWPAAYGVFFLKVQVSAPDEVQPDPVLPAAAPWQNTGVTAVPQNITYVDNGVQTVTAAATGVAGSAIAASSFTLLNSGVATGTQTITWRAYACANATPSAGDTLVSSGTNPGIAVGTPVPITITGNWPPGTSGTRYLIVEISSADDTNPANNIKVSAAVTVTAPDVKYKVPAVTNTPPSIAGGTINGAFTLNNFGTVGGTQTVSWTAYVSTNSTNTIDAGAKVVDSGTHPPVGAGLSPVQTFGGTWPAAPGTYYLKVLITAADNTDVTPGDNTMVSALVVTTVPDYDVPLVTNAGPAMAGRALSGTFTLHNGGSADGTKTVNWTAFASTNAVLDASAIAVAAGTTGPLNATVSQAGIPFSGTWPSATGNFYLLVKVAAADDMNPTNDVGASAVVPVVAPDVNYSVTAVNNTGLLVSGGPLAGNFTLHNGGSVTGIQTVHWTVYASPGNAIIDASDTVVASGSVAALGPGGTQTNIGFSGTWPAAFGPYYLIVLITAGDDQPPGGKTGAIGALTVTHVDYTVTAVNWISGTAAGAPFTASFTVRNNGDAGGTQNLYWSAYTSPTPTLGAGANLVASGFFGPPYTSPPFAAGTQQGVPFGGSWPSTVGNYYLVVSVTASDESTALIADDINHTAAAVVVVPPNVDYIVVPGSVTGTMAPPVAPATPVAGSFQYRNQGLNNGSQWVTWTVYASPNPTLDSYAISIASGMAPPLNSFQTSGSIPFNGTWPLAYNNYYLLVAVSAQEDVNPGNNTAPSAGTTPVGIYTGIVQKGTFTPWASFTDLTGVVLQPGMSIVVHTANMPTAQTDHTYRFNTGTANTFTATWALDVPILPLTSAPSLGLYYYTSGATFDANQSYNIANVNSISIQFTPDAHNAVRLLDLFQNNPRQNLLSYTLTITAN